MSSCWYPIKLVASIQKYPPLVVVNQISSFSKPKNPSKLASSFIKPHFRVRGASCSLFRVGGSMAKVEVDPVAKIKKIINSNPLVVFSKTYCTYCARVKALFFDIGVRSLKILELDVEDDGKELQNALVQLTGQHTVPNVWVSASHIGGCDDTEKLHREGKLVPMLMKAGVLPQPASS